MLGGRPVEWTYDEQAPREGHSCSLSDLSNVRRNYQSWRITRTLPVIVDEIREAELQRARR